MPLHCALESTEIKVSSCFNGFWYLKVGGSFMFCTLIHHVQAAAVLSVFGTAALVPLPELQPQTGSLWAGEQRKG